MSQASKIHPSAIVSPEAELADDVVVGAQVIIEGPVRVGPGCVLRPRASLCGPLTMGQGNVVFSGAILGERPQHLKYADEPTETVIGDFNIFRENVTIHRGTTHSWKTVIGNNNFFMVNCHVGHDTQVGNRCILTNGALVGGHCTIDDNAYLSGNSAVHQFTHIGRLSMLGGCAITTKDIPPFLIQQGINNVVAVNVVGMRRAGMTVEQIDEVRRAFRILFRERLPVPAAIRQIEKEMPHSTTVAELIAFIRQSKRGINFMHARRGEAA